MTLKWTADRSTTEILGREVVAYDVFITTSYPSLGDGKSSIIPDLLYLRIRAHEGTSTLFFQTTLCLTRTKRMIGYIFCLVSALSEKGRQGISPICHMGGSTRRRTLFFLSSDCFLGRMDKSSLLKKIMRHFYSSWNNVEAINRCSVCESKRK